MRDQGEGASFEGKGGQKRTNAPRTARAGAYTLAGVDVEHLSLAGARQEEVSWPSLDSFNVSDETSVLRVKLALAQAEITKLKAAIHSMANPQGLYFVEGVQLDLPESMLTGWTCYYHAPYYNATTTDDIFGPELGTFVLMGAKRRGSSSLAVAAMGRRSVVLDKTTDERDTTLENGVYWYRYWNTFGFADTDEVWLNDCDVVDREGGNKRVSWFVDQRIGSFRTTQPHLSLNRFFASPCARRFLSKYQRAGFCFL